MALNARISNTNQEPTGRNNPVDTESDGNPTVDNRRLNKVKVILLLMHIFISIVCGISLIVLIW